MPKHANLEDLIKKKPYLNKRNNTQIRRNQSVHLCYKWSDDLFLGHHVVDSSI